MTTPQLTLNLEPEKPSEIVTQTSQEFFDLCNRADRLQQVDGKWIVAQRREFAIETYSVVPGQPASYKVRLRWH